MFKKIVGLLLVVMASCGWGGEKFDWSKVLNIPPGSDQIGGNQILHFKSVNKHYSKDAQATAFVQEYLLDAQALTSDAEVLRFGSDQVKISGLFIELGVCTGKTINFLAALNPHQQIYGFDSFEGLPEDWIRRDKVIAKGTFKYKNPDALPPVLHNVVLIKGWFNETLPNFVKKYQEPIAFLHVDSDIYSAAATAFEILGDHIQPGTVIVFDEMYNYPGFENHEFKAFQEFLNKRQLKAKYLAYNIYHEQVAIQIIAQ